MYSLTLIPVFAMCLLTYFAWVAHKTACALGAELAQIHVATLWPKRRLIIRFKVTGVDKICASISAMAEQMSKAADAIQRAASQLTWDEYRR